jgi:hypothetical protein
MIGCLNCGKEINPETGRRPKKFCSDKCRASFNAKNRNKEPKWVQRETYEKLMEENKRLKEQIQAIAKPAPQEMVVNPVKTVKTKLPQSKESPKPPISINSEDPIPVKQDGEDALDFAVRKNEWKKRQNK